MKRQHQAIIREGLRRRFGAGEKQEEDWGGVEGWRRQRAGWCVDGG